MIFFFVIYDTSRWQTKAGEARSERGKGRESEGKKEKKRKR